MISQVKGENKDYKFFSRFFLNLYVIVSFNTLNTIQVIY